MWRCNLLAIGCLLLAAGCAGTQGRVAKWRPKGAETSSAQPVAAAQSAADRTEREAEPEVQLVSHDSGKPKPEPPVPAEGDSPVFAARKPRQSPDSDTRSIDLAAALAGVSAENPQVAFANERIREAYAQLRAARVLWLPSIRAGVYYGKHDGPLQTDAGEVPVSSRSAMEAGLGMAAVGGGSPSVPGVAANFRLTDAVFQPRIADQERTARQHAATATTHDLLLFVAVAYLDLLRAFQQQAIAQETLDHAEQLAELTAAFARTGQGSQADADRAQTELAVRKNAVAQAASQAKVASARLAELLNLEPTRLLAPQEPTVVPIDLVSQEATVAQLVAQGLSQRPELAESRHLVAEAVQRLDRERYAPLLPSVLLGISQGGYGGGPGSTVADFRGRFDLDATAYWELRNFGLGDAAAREAARSRLEQARLLQIQIMDRVAREIVEAHAQSESLRGQIEVARSGVQAAIQSYQRNLGRIRGGQGLPIEVLQSLQALDVSRREYLRAVADYNEAQFRLHRALGWPIEP